MTSASQGNGRECHEESEWGEQRRHEGAKEKESGEARKVSEAPGVVCWGAT
jgi:hypothetical protein